MESTALLPAALGFLFGAFIGSFLNVCIHRLPRNESVVLPPSRCYSCGTQVQWYDNLPIVSYLILRGRCRWCDASFSIRYLLLEVLVGIVSALVMWWAFTSPMAPAPWLLALGVAEPIARAVAGAVILALAYLLVVSSFIDLEHTIIPDELTKSFQLAAPFLALGTGSVLGLQSVFDPMSWLVQRNIILDVSVPTTATFVWNISLVVGVILVGLAASLPLARVIYSRFCPPEQRWSDHDHRGFRIGVLWFIGVTIVSALVPLVLAWWQPGEGGWWRVCAVHGALALFGSLTGWLSLYLVGLIGTIAFRRNAMGFGDVKFLAPVGAFLGPVGVLYAFFFAAIVGTLVGLPMRLLASRREIPFGPWLAVGAFLALVWGPQLHHWLFSQIRLA